MDPKGRIAIVTGASSGIGASTAVALARAGSRVVVAARRADKLEATVAMCRAEGAEAVAIRTDVRIREDCVALVRQTNDRFGPPEILVNNAGFAIFDTIADARPDDIRSMMDTNYLGAVNCTQAALPGMIARGCGAIVNVASIVGIMGFAGMGAYCATKFALVGFSEALRSEVIARGIRVSLVCPGTTDTEFFDTAMREKSPAAERLILAVPPERVARAVMRAVRGGKARIIVPWPAGLYMRFKELAPGTAHFLMRKVSEMIERRGR
ncbi:MAG: SDR family oxidoreductase [Acidobacteria bacterium]|nr:SDR family oxidoreductase [Acidobacteriota bacterium]